MSPVRACAAHGAPNCARCARKPARRRYSDTAAYRQVRDEVLERDGAVCVYCDKPIDLHTSSPDPLELAHVIPHQDGGEFTTDNVRPSHQSCNRAAGRQPITHG